MEVLGSPDSAGCDPLTPLCHAGTCILGFILCPDPFPGCSYLYLDPPPLPLLRSLCSHYLRSAVWCRPCVFVLPVLSGKYWGDQLSIELLRLPPVRNGQTSSKQVNQVPRALCGHPVGLGPFCAVTCGCLWSELCWTCPIPGLPFTWADVTLDQRQPQARRLS